MLKCVAIKYINKEDGKTLILSVPEKGRHCHIFNFLYPYYDRPKLLEENHEVQGFLDDQGNFLNRIEAKKHAFDCGQINKTIAFTLTSEDLW